MKKQFQEYAGKFDALTLRERVIAMLVVIAVVFMIWDLLIGGPLDREEVKYKQELQSLTDSNLAASQEIQSLIKKNAVDPYAREKQRITQLEEQIQGQDRQITSLTTDIVSPKEMARLLENMLVQQNKLEVIKLESMDSDSLLEPYDPAMIAEGVSQVYKHGMVIQVSGTYFDLLEFLGMVEGFEWGVLWDAVKIHQQHYPLNSITVELHTISLDKSWIGV